MIRSACAGDACHSERLRCAPEGLGSLLQPAVGSPLRQPAAELQTAGGLD